MAESNIIERMRLIMSEAESAWSFSRREPDYGVHEGLPFWDYLLWEAFGSGDVRKVAHSPAHLRQHWASGKDVNPSLLTGRGLHACVLEPDTEWPKYYRLSDGKDRRSKEYKEMAEEVGSEYVLRDIEYDACIGARDRLFAHTRIGRLMRDGTPELSFAWEDPETGLPLKGRGDWVNQNMGVVFDLKSTGDAREQQFVRVAKNLGYPQQGAHYTTGLMENDVDVRDYVIVAAEIDPPYEPVMYRVSSKDMMIADAHWRAMVDLLAHCIMENRWPGYPEHTHVLNMGPWWEADIQNEIATMRELVE